MLISLLNMTSLVNILKNGPTGMCDFSLVSFWEEEGRHGLPEVGLEVMTSSALYISFYAINQCIVLLTQLINCHQK